MQAVQDQIFSYYSNWQHVNICNENVKIAIQHLKKDMADVVIERVFDNFIDGPDRLNENVKDLYDSSNYLHHGFMP